MSKKETKRDLILSRMDWVRANAERMNYTEMAAILGMTSSYLCMILKANGMTLDKSRIRERARQKLQGTWRKRRLMKDSPDPAERAAYERFSKACSESRKELFRAERRRELFGLPRKTRLKIHAQPKAVLQQRWKLKKRGYVIERGGRVAYYTDNTERCRDAESRWKFFKFLPLGAKEERKPEPKRVCVREAYDGNIHFNL